MSDDHDVELAKPKAEASRSEATTASVALEATRVIQSEQTKRTQIICGTILAGIIVVGGVAVELTTPAWATILTAVAAAFLAPSGVVLTLLKVI